MIPLRYDGGTAVFTIQQVETYGLPEDWGFHDFEVIETPRYQVYATDFKFEKSRGFKMLRDKHRYNRVERFRSTFLQLMGVRGEIDSWVVTVLKYELLDVHPDHIYESIRKALKRYKWRRYYNRIGSLIHALGYPYSIRLKVDYQEIENTFRKASALFDRIKHRLDRSYFPNLRYWSLKLLELYGAEFGYKIPFIRTHRKEQLLNVLWNKLLN